MRLLTLAIFLSTSLAQACPDLVGTFSNCYENDFPTQLSDITITQITLNDKTTYAITSTNTGTYQRSTVSREEGSVRTDRRSQSLVIEEKVRCVGDDALNIHSTWTHNGTITSSDDTFMRKSDSKLIISRSTDDQARPDIICE